MRKHHAAGKFFLLPVILHFDKKGSLAPYVKKRTCVPLFFRFCFESGHWGYPTEKSASISFLRGTGRENHSGGHQGNGEIGASNLLGRET